MPRSTPIDRAPRTVVAYHGCRREVAEALAAGEAPRLSTNRYDWLGVGVYFWEYAPFRAREWAVRRFGEDAAVIRARVRLGRCLNLLDTEYVVQLREAYQEALLLAADSGQSLPSNLPDGRHHLDRLILELFCAMSVNRAGRSVQTIRGCFPEGEPAFPGSRILERTHVQLSVRDLSCIKSVSLVTWGQEARGLRGGPVDGAQE